MLTPEQVQAYRSDGFVTVSDVFSPAELEPTDAYLRANADVRWTDKNDDPLREAHYHFRPIYDLCTTPRLLDAVEALLGPDLVLLYAHILNKKPGGMRVAWHQDGPYWPRVEPKIAVTAWIALDDADADNGCMRVIPGTHAGHRDLGQQLSGRADLIQDNALELPAGVANEADAVDVTMRRGDVSFHDSYLVHGSEPNHSGRRRAALTVRYVPAATRIQDRPDRRQFLVRGRPTDNGNTYHHFPAPIR